MFYDELDIISAHPVSLLEFSGNRLYTTWGNVRNTVDVSYNPTLSYKGMTLGTADNTFVFGITGDPLSKLGLSDSRIGFVFQNSGTKATYVDLNNIPGTDSEGKWENIISTNVNNSADGSIDRETTLSADMKNYSNQAINQFNVGFAKKGLILEDLVAGFSIARQSNYTKRITGGTKSYKLRYLNDNGMPAGYPTGTREGETYELTYADNDRLDNSLDITDLLLQARLEPISDLRVDVGLGIRLQDNYNPNSLIKNSITVSKKDDNLIGTTVVYDTGKAIRNPATLGNLNYNDFTGLVGDFTGALLWTPAWAGGVNAPALVDFSDDRKGTGFLVRAEAGYKLFDVPITGVFNLSLVPQKLDCSEKYVDYIKTQDYVTATAQDTWVARDYTQDVKTTGDIKNSSVDFGLKFDIIKNEYINVAFGGFLRSDYTLNDWKAEINSTEITSYDDGVAGNNPGTVAIGVRPGPANGEGVWKQTVENETTGKTETLITRMSVPVGAEIPITKKWTFRAGSQYTLTKTKTVTKATAGKTKTVTSVTPAGGSETKVTVIADPTADYLNDSTVYTEAHTITYTYGIEWSPNPNLTLACNAFLDTNPNELDAGAGGANNKATIFDLDTYRLLAIQAVFKF